jgi:5-methyltetrahydrofolate--homocysteine methyltransferase
VEPVNPPQPPFWGARVVPAIDLLDIAPLMDQQSLFRLQWGARGAKGDQWERLLVDEFLPRFHRYTRELAGIVQPRGTYGYYRCRPEGDGLVLHLDGQEVGRLEFARQGSGEYLCLADYFGPDDVIALQAVTVGSEVSRAFAHLDQADQYSEAYYLHGYAVEAAEATAEWLHRTIRRELGLAPEQGKRYSWGYPAIPDLAAHGLIARLLPFGEVGLELSDAWQLIPEASTVAMVVHHPAAKYFAVEAGGRP